MYEQHVLYHVECVHPASFKSPSMCCHLVWQAMGLPDKSPRTVPTRIVRDGHTMAPHVAFRPVREDVDPADVSGASPRLQYDSTAHHDGNIVKPQPRMPVPQIGEPRMPVPQ